MKKRQKFIRLDINEFENWLNNIEITNSIKYIQLHHTEQPSYDDFNGENHFDLCFEMEKSHIERGFGGIAQNFTTFPDGDIMICRSLTDKTIGIKGANDFAINIENLGNFDIDDVSKLQRKTIVQMTKLLCNRFSIQINESCILYHHWFDLISGNRIIKEEKGKTKSCPGKNFFGGNSFDDFKKNLLPLLQQPHSHG